MGRSGAGRWTKPCDGAVCFILSLGRVFVSLCVSVLCVPLFVRLFVCLSVSASVLLYNPLSVCGVGAVLRGGRADMLSRAFCRVYAFCCSVRVGLFLCV